MTFCVSNILTVSSTMFPHKDVHKYTWTSLDGRHQDQIEHVTVRSQLNRSVQDPDHVYLRHLSTECRSILSADMATDTWPIYRPTLGRVSVACRSTWTDKHVGRHPADTSPPLGRHSADTLPTLAQAHLQIGQLLLPSSIFPTLLREAFSGRRPFLTFNSGNIHVFFPAMFFPRHRFYIRPSLLSDAAAFGDCCFWRLVILGEQKMI